MLEEWRGEIQTEKPEGNKLLNDPNFRNGNYDFERINLSDIGNGK